MDQLPVSASADGRPRILVVEDDPHIGPRVAAALRREGFDAVLIPEGPAARAALLRESFALVILDLMLPGEDGLSLLEAWQGRSPVPVIVLTAQVNLDARLRSFALGAVDWLPKPFFFEELLARVRVRLGQTAAPPPPRRLIELGESTLDLDAHTVTRAGAPLELTPHELHVLVVLATHPGRAFTRDQLAEKALGSERERLPRVIDSHISRLRRKLGADGDRICTVVGIGYRLDLPAAAGG